MQRIPYFNQEQGELTVQQLIDHAKLLFQPSARLTYFFGSGYLIKFKKGFQTGKERSKEEWQNFKNGLKKLKSDVTCMLDERK